MEKPNKKPIAEISGLTKWAAKQAAQCRGTIKYYIAEGIPLEKSLEMALDDSILSKKIKDEIVKEFKQLTTERTA